MVGEGTVVRLSRRSRRKEFTSYPTGTVSTRGVRMCEKGSTTAEVR